jgi:hypothetical protein
LIFAWWFLSRPFSAGRVRRGQFLKSLVQATLDSISFVQNLPQPSALQPRRRAA